MDYKNLLLSKGAWGSVIVMAAGALGISGQLNSDATLATDTSTWIVSLISLIFGGVALYGRWVAKGPLALPGSTKLLPTILVAAIALPLALSLAACDTLRAVGGEKGEAAAATFEQLTLKGANDALDGVKMTQGLILVYLGYEICSPDHPEVLLCRKPKQSAKLQALSASITAKLKPLRALFEAKPTDMEVALAITNAATGFYTDYYTAKKETQ